MADQRRNLAYRAAALYGAGWLLAGALCGCDLHAPAEVASPAAPAELPTIDAEVMTVTSSVYPAIERAQGSLVADEVTIVGAKVAGRVAEVHVDIGDAASAGAPLATLDRSEFQLRVVLAKAQLVQARSALGMKEDDPLEQLVPQNAPPVREAQAIWDESKTRTERLKRLIPRNAATQEDLDAAVAAERVAEARHSSAINSTLEKIALIRVRSAELSLAEQQFNDAVIIAPFDGQVQERHVAHGSYVQVGEPIATLVRTGKLRFRGTMPERHAQRLALRQEVKLSIESVPEPITAKITRLSPVVEERNRSLMFEVELANDNGRLRTGLFAEAAVIVDPQARAIVIPPSALVEFAGTEKVWQVVDGVVREKVVQTSRRTSDGVEITGGLSEGDLILRDASQGRSARIAPLAASAPTESPPSPDDATASSGAPPESDHSP